MGRTKTSKLLTAKRPGLIPIWDDKVGNTIASRAITGHYGRSDVRIPTMERCN